MATNPINLCNVFKTFVVRLRLLLKILLKHLKACKQSNYLYNIEGYIHGKSNNNSWALNVFCILNRSLSTADDDLFCGKHRSRRSYSSFILSLVRS
jgi:hypothetical protein